MTNKNRSIIVAAAIAVVVIVALVATFVVSGGNSSPSSSSAPAATVTKPVITGDKLPDMTEQGNDPAIGLPVPLAQGTDYSGRAVSIEKGAQVILVGAHWCPHCNREIPKVVSWLASGELSRDVRYTLVSTAVRENEPNFPPAKWLDDMGWDGPVLADDNMYLARLGVTSFPAFVVVKADGTVAARLAGEQPLSALQQALRDAGLPQR